MFSNTPVARPPSGPVAMPPRSPARRWPRSRCPRWRCPSPTASAPSRAVDIAHQGPLPARPAPRGKARRQAATAGSMPAPSRRARRHRRGAACERRAGRRGRRGRRGRAACRRSTPTSAISARHNADRRRSRRSPSGRVPAGSARFSRRPTHPPCRRSSTRSSRTTSNISYSNIPQGRSCGTPGTTPTPTPTSATAGCKQIAGARTPCTRPAPSSRASAPTIVIVTTTARRRFTDLADLCRCRCRADAAAPRQRSTRRPS